MTMVMASAASGVATGSAVHGDLLFAALNQAVRDRRVLSHSEFRAGVTTARSPRVPAGFGRPPPPAHRVAGAKYCRGETPSSLRNIAVNALGVA